jgi:hypothetical protein
MATNGLENMTPQELSFELQQGARFIVYQYCISMVFLTLKRPSKVVIVRPGESRVTKSLRFTLLSAVLGWWGIPWGPIYTIQSLWVNLKGGKDITDGIMQALNRQAGKATAAAKA